MVTCDEIPRAAAIAAELDTVEEVREQADGLLVFAPEDTAGPLTSALVAAGVTVRGIRPNQRSLEDVFLEMTSDTVAERQA